MDKYLIDLNYEAFEQKKYFYNIFFESLNIFDEDLINLLKTADKKYVYKRILKLTKILNVSKKKIKCAYFKADIISKKQLKKDRIKRYNGIERVDY